MKRDDHSSEASGHAKGKNEPFSSRQRQNRRRSGGYAPFSQRDQDFRCLHCRMQVSGNPHLSGVRNRNHCPYCLYSQHVDLHTAGDRLADCKAEMKPIGLTLKQTRKKYGPSTGELMLVHVCLGCGKLSINRIAADDLTYKVLEMLDGFNQLDESILLQMQENGIHALQPGDRAAVERQLGVSSAN